MESKIKAVLVILLAIAYYAIGIYFAFVGDSLLSAAGIIMVLLPIIGPSIFVVIYWVYCTLEEYFDRRKRERKNDR